METTLTAESRLSFKGLQGVVSQMIGLHVGHLSDVAEQRFLILQVLGSGYRGGLVCYLHLLNTYSSELQVPILGHALSLLILPCLQQSFITGYQRRTQHETSVRTMRNTQIESVPHRKHVTSALQSPTGQCCLRKQSLFIVRSIRNAQIQCVCVRAEYCITFLINQVVRIVTSLL
jgi:hypothetical protein